MENNIFKYQPISNSLYLVKKNCKKDVYKILSNQNGLDLNNSTMILFFSFDYTKTFQKYSNLSLSLGFIEIGIIAQTIHLLCKDYRYSSCDIGGFDKPLSEKILNLDGINQHVIYSIIIGREKND